MILFFILALMLLCYFLSATEDYFKPYYRYIVWGIILLMIVISGTRPGTSVSDYSNYENMFYNFDSSFLELSVEPTFLGICKFIYNLGGTFRWVIWIYVFISIPLKVYSFSKMVPSEIFFLAIPIYLANFFQLHDCEQMRVAAALSFAMYAFLQKIEGKKWLWIPFYLIAISFHHTAAALIIPLLVTPLKAMNKIWRIGLVAVVIIGILCWIVKINPITSLPIPYIEVKMEQYELGISNGEHPDILVIHPTVLLRIVTFIYVIFFYDIIYENMKCLNLVLICEAIGLFCWFALSETSVFAVRMSELFEVTEIILFSSVIYTIKPINAGKIYPILFALYLFIYGYRVNQFGFAS